jgi:hypothetical protein
LWFSTNSFETPVQDTFGDAGREIIDGPGFVNLDFSLFKNFPAAFINEEADFTLRVEAWNFFNTPHFNNPNGSTSSGNFGKVTSAQNDSRQFQLGLTLRF